MVFRDNRDYRIGAEKLGGVRSIDKVRKNYLHPASTEALRRRRELDLSRPVVADPPGKGPGQR